MTDSVKHFFRYQFPAILWAIIIYIASSIPAKKLPKIALQINDKVIHIGIFFVFGLLVYRALEPRIPSLTLSWKRIGTAVTVATFYGLTDELHQGLVPGRTLDIKDISADAFGALLAALIIFLYNRRKNPSRPAHS